MATPDFTLGLFDKAPDYAALAKSHERKRQGVLNLGTKQINALFGGGTAPFYTMATDRFTSPEWHQAGKKQSFYHLNRQGQFAPYFVPKKKDQGGSSAAETGNLFGGGVGGVLAGLGDGDIKGATMSAALGLPGQMKVFGGLFGGSDPLTPRQLVNRQIRKGQLFEAPNMQTFEGFQQPFYDARAKAYEDFAMPQLGEQYRQNRDQMLFGLSNRGIQNSTIADKAASQLERATGQGKQQIAESGIAQANALKNQVEASRQEAINQLYQTADPARAFQSAIASASQLRQPSVFAPLTNMFGNLANQYYFNKQQQLYGQGVGQVPQQENYFAPI